MGGPQQADEERLHPWLGPEKALLRDAVARALPLLGVCLGCQLLADAHGGSVAPLPEIEVGILDFTLTAEGRADPLFAGLPAATLTMQWHLKRGHRAPPARRPAGALRRLRRAGLPAGATRLRRAVPHGGGRRPGARHRGLPRLCRRAGAAAGRRRLRADGRRDGPPRGDAARQRRTPLPQLSWTWWTRVPRGTRAGCTMRGTRAGRMSRGDRPRDHEERRDGSRSVARDARGTHGTRRRASVGGLAERHADRRAAGRVPAADDGRRLRRAGRAGAKRGPQGSRATRSAPPTRRCRCASA